MVRELELQASLRRDEYKTRSDPRSSITGPASIEVGEPASKHRAELDRKWSEEAEPKATAKTRRRVPPPSPRAPADRIVTKWYFWVTVGAIVASAAAVTAIAIRASRDDEPDALSLEPGPRSMGPTLLRF